MGEGMGRGVGRVCRMGIWLVYEEVVLGVWSLVGVTTVLQRPHT